MNNIAKTIKRIAAILSLTAIAACNNSDDVSEIFIGHDWKLSFIQEAGTRRWPSQEHAYEITFTANTFNATTPTGGKISGRWSANGKTKEFRCSNIRYESIGANDTIANRMLQMFKDAASYGGDTHYLQIIKDRNHFMQFYNR
jgi:hypothetical protein